MNGDFQHKLFHYEAKPPVSVWNEIAAALDEAPHSFPEKLLQYEQPPSKTVWAKISEQLNASAKAPVVSLLRRKAVQYVAAAAVFLLAIYGGFLLLGQKSNELAKQTLPAKSNVFQNKDSGTTHQNTALNSNTAVSLAFNEVPQKRKMHYVRLATKFPKIAERPGKKLQEKLIALQEKNIVDASSADRYMIATSTSGKVVRLPKKAYADFACVERTDIACKEKMASIQSKLASASISTDFAGVLDLLKNLQDNQ